jgi:hypothetical protein
VKARCCCVIARGAGRADAATRLRMELLAAHASRPPPGGQLPGTVRAPSCSFGGVDSANCSTSIVPSIANTTRPCWPWCATVQRHLPSLRPRDSACDANCMSGRSAMQRANTGMVRPYWMTMDEDGDGRRDQPCMPPAAWRVLGLVLQTITLTPLGIKCSRTFFVGATDTANTSTTPS